MLSVAAAVELLVHVGLLLSLFSPAAIAFTPRMQPSQSSYQTLLSAADTRCSNEVEVTSLASLFSVHGSIPSENQFVWALIPLPAVKEGNGDGAVAKAALKAQAHSSSAATYTLDCKVDNTNADVLRMNLSTMSNNGNVHDGDESFLLGILSRILVQWAAAQCSELSSSKADRKEVHLSLDPGSTFGGDYHMDANDLLSNNPIALFDDILENASSLEMSEMVSSSGNKLGVVPRPIVHKLNLLHRGIGMVVCKGRHITQDIPDETLPEVYCHRRTESKRVFPSLFDMFVGGVSTAGEDAILTASREIAEELGLLRALNDPSGDALAGPLFKCTVCTSYNRCVVTMFTYRCMDDEIIKWQEEEVQWGGWVSYRDIESSATLSINRLKDRGNWPGSGICTDNTMLEIDRASGFEGETWDYVPDGLLVWEAWVRWRKAEAY